MKFLLKSWHCLTRRQRFVGVVLLTVFVLAITWLTQSTPIFFAVLGHASFLITFLSFAQTNIILLRVISVFALTVGLVYNTYVHVSMPLDQNLWPVLIWMGVFWFQNVGLTIRSIINGQEVTLAPKDRMLAVKTLPKLHSRDWLLLTDLGTFTNLVKGATILRVGDATTHLTVLASGTVDEIRADVPLMHRGEGTIFGEITLVMGAEEYNSSPCHIVVTSATAQTLSWSYTALDALSTKHPRLWAAMLDGFMRSAAFKHGLLKEREQDSPEISGQVRFRVVRNEIFS